MGVLAGVPLARVPLFGVLTWDNRRLFSSSRFLKRLNQNNDKKYIKKEKYYNERKQDKKRGTKRERKGTGGSTSRGKLSSNNTKRKVKKNLRETLKRRE